MRRIIFFLIVFFSFGIGAFGQSPPDLPSRTGTILYPIVTLSFGEFTLLSGSGGGTVSVSCTGMRTSTGDVFLYDKGSFPVHTALFEFKLCPGRTVTITYPTSLTISGINGTVGSMVLSKLNFLIDNNIPNNPGSGVIRFTSNKGCNEIHQIYMGGTLNVSSLSINPMGLYHIDVPLTITLQ